MNDMPPIDPDADDEDRFDIRHLPARPIINADGTISLEPLPNASEEQRAAIANMHIDGQWHEPQPGVFEKLPVN